MTTLFTSDIASFERLRVPAELLARAGIIRVTDRQAREQQVIQSREFFFVKRVAAVYDDVAVWRERARADERWRVVFARVLLSTKRKFVSRP